MNQPLEILSVFQIAGFTNIRIVLVKNAKSVIAIVRNVKLEVVHNVLHVILANIYIIINVYRLVLIIFILSYQQEHVKLVMIHVVLVQAQMKMNVLNVQVIKKKKKDFYKVKNVN